MNQADFTEVRTENLKKAQATRKEESLERVYKAIERLQKIGGKINFPAIAKEANVSVSYLYKYPELKQHIGELRNQQSSIPRHFITKSTTSDAQAKIVSRLKERIRQLEERNTNLQRKSEALAGQVYRVHHLQEQVTRQEQTIQDLESRLKAASNTPFAPSTAKVTSITQAKTYSGNDLIRQEIERSGVRLTETLKRVICQYDETRVSLAIQAYNQYKELHSISSPGGCLRKAIEQGWMPNQLLTKQSSEQDEFDRFYAIAVMDDFLLDIPKNHLSVEQGEWVVKINRPSLSAPWTPVNWREAKIEYERTK
jgi:uncharacterized protein YigA (DUF484 family)